MQIVEQARVGHTVTNGENGVKKMQEGQQWSWYNYGKVQRDRNKLLWVTTKWCSKGKKVADVLGQRQTDAEGQPHAGIH